MQINCHTDIITADQLVVWKRNICEGATPPPPPPEHKNIDLQPWALRAQG